MSKLIVHTLVHRSVHNVNRDKYGRPKKCHIGGTERGRHSSQSWKQLLSDIFRKNPNFPTGQQTSLIGRYALDKLIAGGVDEEKAKEYALKIIDAFASKDKSGKNGTEDKEDKKGGGKKKDPFKTEVIKIQDCEVVAVDHLITKIHEGYVPEKKDYDFLRANESVDIALFGRMLTKEEKHSVEAAVSVSHAFTVDISSAEEDHFTATDTLQECAKTEEGKSHKGSAHMDNFYFAEGVFYYSLIIDVGKLQSDLKGSTVRVSDIIRDLLEIVAMASPKACAHRAGGSIAYAAYMMVEKCDRFPRQLGLAFQDAIEGPRIMEKAIDALEAKKAAFDAIYGEMPAKSFSVLDETKTPLQDVINFAVEDFQED